MADTQPKEVAPNVWRVLDPNHGRYYYYNRSTGETTWTPPPGVADAVPPAQPSARPSPPQPMQIDGGGPQGHFGSQGYGGPHGSHGGFPGGSYDNRGSANGYGHGFDDRGHRGGHHEPSPPPRSLVERASEVHVHGIRVQPWEQFEDCRFPPQIMNALHRAGFPSPSGIQAYSWPILTEGRDLIGVAKTGSGKTLGFLLPAFRMILERRLDPHQAGGPLQLVMAPTRELACQIEAEAEKFGVPVGMNCAVAYGGAPKGAQLQQLRRGAHVLIATPGRLNDFLQMGAVRLRSVMFLVLDEADRMLDMGFEPQIRQIVAEIPTQRQTMMFTATWPKEVRKLAEEFLYNPAQVQIGNTDALQANADIEQRVIILNNPYEKQDRLLHLLRQECSHGEKVLIFTSTKRMCDQLARYLESHGRMQCVSIHGDREQRERDAALAAFKSGRSPVMVATDVAARGLDVKHVKMVVNFDPANNAEDYVHRIGRTGRAGEKGLAFTLLGPDEGKHAKEICDVMQKTGFQPPADLMNLAMSAGRGGGRSRGGGGGKGGGMKKMMNMFGGSRFSPY